MSFTFTATVGMVPQPTRTTFHEALEDLINGILATEHKSLVFLEQTCWIALGGFSDRAEMVLMFYGCRDFGFKVGLLNEVNPTKVLHEVGDPPEELIRKLFAVSMVTGGDPEAFIEALPPYSQAA